MVDGWLKIEGWWLKWLIRFQHYEERVSTTGKMRSPKEAPPIRRGSSELQSRQMLYAALVTSWRLRPSIAGTIRVANSEESPRVWKEKSMKYDENDEQLT